MKIANLIAGVVSGLGLLCTFGSIGNLDYTEACGSTLSAADIFTEFTKAWIGLLIFAAGAAFMGLVEYYKVQKESNDVSKRRNEA